MKTGIVIIFPGTGYTCKEKLLVDCTLKYRNSGFDVINLDFSSVPFKEIKTLEAAVDSTKPIILEQLKDIIFEEYSEVIFISKSLGTVCANWTEKNFNITPAQYYLTPLKNSLDTIKASTKVNGMIIGTQDKLLDYKVMELFCIERNIPYLVINNVGHDLEDYEDDLRTEAITNQLVKFCTAK